LARSASAGDSALGVGVEHDSVGRVAVGAVQFGEIEPRELPGRTLVGVVVALVPNVEVHEYEIGGFVYKPCGASGDVGNVTGDR